MPAMISKHEHRWVDDPLFSSGAVTMITNDNPDRTLGKEVRQYCTRCPAIRYVSKDEN